MIRNTGGVMMGAGFTGQSSSSAFGSAAATRASASALKTYTSKSYAGAASTSALGMGSRRLAIAAGGSTYGLRSGTAVGTAGYYGSGVASGGVLYGSTGVLGAAAGLRGGSGFGRSVYGGPGVTGPGGLVPGSVVPGNRGPMVSGPRLTGPGFGSPGIGAPGFGAPGIGGLVPSVPPPLTAVSVNPLLLAPLDLTVDPTIQNNRTLEKEQMKNLNNQFASFINKVRDLEQQNKLLETKWILLQEQSITRSNIDTMYEAYITNIRRQVDSLTNEKVKLDGELRNMQSVVTEYKTRYEEEINKRATAENEFVLLKKDVDTVYRTKVDLESQDDTLQDQINFLRAVYEEELRELRSQITDTSAVIEMDTSRSLEMDSIVKEVRAQYDAIATASRAETTAWYQARFQELGAISTQFTDDLRTTKLEMAEATRVVTSLRNEIEMTNVQIQSLKVQITDVTTRGEESVVEAKERLTQLQEALMKAKQDVTRQVVEYQELMNIKLGLDIEIATYKKLLDGEEWRLSAGSAATIHVQSADGSYRVDTVGGGLASAAGGTVVAGGALSMAGGLARASSLATSSGAIGGTVGLAGYGSSSMALGGQSVAGVQAASSSMVGTTMGATSSGAIGGTVGLAGYGSSAMAMGGQRVAGGQAASSSMVGSTMGMSTGLTGTALRF